MADNARPPVAVRIVRPYETEEAFLESELETVGKTSVILIGAHSRPTGVILRFEVTLASGATVLRGEGRVLAHKENAFRGQPGLALRFTRLDPKSKALVDRAAAIREARLNDGAGRPASVPPPAPTPEPQTNPPPRPSNAPSMRPQTGSMRPQPGSMRPSATSVRPTAPPQTTTTSMPAPDPVLTQILTAPTPPPPQSAFPARRGGRTSQRPTSAPSQPQQEQVAREEERGDERPSTLVDDQEAEAALAANHAATVAVPSAPSDPPSPPTIPPAARPAPPNVAASTDGAARALAPPPNRDDLLSRLRQRSANMSEEQRASILNRR